mmetsp:Transcript_19723/g.43107  ORF Transcript_19723/g.43107 Transcript_19723/m.43107 type:complete len:317 (-) Transcript_19723:1262-2212(-)
MGFEVKLFLNILLSACFVCSFGSSCVMGNTEILREPCEVHVVTFLSHPTLVRNRLRPYVRTLKKGNCCKHGVEVKIVCKEGGPHSRSHGCDWQSRNVGGENYDIAVRMRTRYSNPPAVTISLSEQRLRRSPRTNRLSTIVHHVSQNCSKLTEDWFFDGVRPLGTVPFISTHRFDQQAYNFSIEEWLGGTRTKLISDLLKSSNLPKHVVARKVKYVRSQGQLTPANPRPYGSWAESHLLQNREDYLHMNFTGTSLTQAMFAVTSDGVRQNPKELYHRLENLLSVGINTEAGHFAERSYKYLFTRRRGNCSAITTVDA